LELTDILHFLNKNVFVTLAHSIKMVSVPAVLLDVYLALVQLPAVDVLHPLLLTMMDLVIALLDSILKLPPLDSVSNVPNIVQLVLLPTLAKHVLLISFLSMELVLVLAEDSLAMDNAYLVFLVVKLAQVLLLATSVIPLFFFKQILV
jgi:hypothetical protein